MPVDYRDQNYGTLRQRTLEWERRELVSLLDIKGIGPYTRKALRGLDISVASELAEADPEELARSLEPFSVPPCGPHAKRVAIIKGWQDEIRRRWAEREQQGSENRSVDQDDEGQETR